MDTISRENTSYLPVAGIIVGVLALVLAAVALAKVSSTGKKIDSLGEQIARIETIENEVRTATTNSEKATQNLVSLRREISEAMNAVSNEIGSVRGEMAKIQEAAKARPVAAAAPSGNGSAKSAPAVAGDEYVIQAHDTGAKIARAKGVSLAELQAVNPGVNWNKLAVGSKIKLPKK